VAKLDVASVQQVLDATEAGDYGPVFESFAENIVVENGPGAGPWRHAEGRDEFANVLLEFSAYFNGTFRQRGRCIYADDRVVTSLIEESGSTPAGDAFENLAVYVTRMGADDKADRLWTVDLDTEACLEFWARNPVASGAMAVLQNAKPPVNPVPTNPERRREHG
jgi:ketosteroid isomerase-like protein